MESDNFLDSYKHMDMVGTMIEWLKFKTEQIKHFGSAVTSGFVPDEIAEQRYNICLECEEFKTSLRQCKLCYCYMPMKVLFKKIECPKQYWGDHRK